jgi:hypothetical protein
MILVFAGDCHLAQNWIRVQSEPSSYKYISRPEQLEGLRDLEYVALGSFYGRTDRNVFLRLITRRGLIKRKYLDFSSTTIPR